MTRYQPYNKDAKCSKCGSDNLSVFYEPFAHWNVVPRYEHCGIEYPHMHRFCRNCSFAWVELPLDSALQPEQTDIQQLNESDAKDIANGKSIKIYGKTLNGRWEQLKMNLHMDKLDSD